MAARDGMVRGSSLTGLATEDAGGGTGDLRRDRAHGTFLGPGMSDVSSPGVDRLELAIPYRLESRADERDHLFLASPE